MKILKRQNWWIWLLLLFFSQGSNILVLGALLDTYKKDAWYTKWYYWVIGLIFVFPFCIMVAVLNIQILSLTAAKLNVSGKELYSSPFLWMILLIIPILGWVLFIVLYLYLEIDILIKLKNGEGEKYL